MSAGVSSDRSVREAYETDASGLHLVPDLVARPASVEDVIELVKRAGNDLEETLRSVLDLGGTVAAEHGIGKVKRRWLPLQMNPLQISMMTAVKRELDPLGILAPGNIL